MPTTLSILIDDNMAKLNAHYYSRFKHGSKSMARFMGQQLAKVVSPSLKPDSSIIVYPAPYNNVPTASSALKDYLLSSLARTFIDKNITVKQDKVHRLYSYDNDYGLMSKEERRLAISSDIFFINKDFIKEDDILVFVDDIRITGSHEERIKEVLEREGINNQVLFIYMFTYVGKEPTIEHILNHESVKNLVDINNIIRNDEFIFNTRVIKYILKANQYEFVNFIQYQSDSFKETLYNLSILNDYHKNEKYLHNFSYLDQLINK